MRIKRRNKNGVLFLISVLLLVLVVGGVVTYIGEKIDSRWIDSRWIDR